MKRPVAVAFGHTLVKARLKAGFSQEKLADVGEFDRSYISLLERGLRMPGLGVLFRLGKVLGTTAEALVGDTRSRLAGTEALIPRPCPPMRDWDDA